MGIVFLANTCKLRQHTLRNFLLKIQWAINAVFSFKYFLLLDKRQWEKLMHLLDQESWQAMKAEVWILTLPQSRQKTEVLERPQQQKKAEKSQSLFGKSSEHRTTIYCVLGACYPIAIPTLECRLGSIWQHIISDLPRVSLCLRVTYSCTSVRPYHWFVCGATATTVGSFGCVAVAL